MNKEMVSCVAIYLNNSSLNTTGILCYLCTIQCTDKAYIHSDMILYSEVRFQYHDSLSFITSHCSYFTLDTFGIAELHY